LVSVYFIGIDNIDEAFVAYGERIYLAGFVAGHPVVYDEELAADCVAGMCVQLAGGKVFCFNADVDAIAELAKANW
jgi:hypothetical protein